MLETQSTHGVAMATFWRTLHYDGKISLACWGEGGGSSPSPYRSVYHHKQSCGVRSSCEGRYTPPISTLPLYVQYHRYSVVWNTILPLFPVKRRSQSYFIFLFGKVRYRYCFVAVVIYVRYEPSTLLSLQNIQQCSVRASVADPDPNPLVRGMDPRIQIRIRIHHKMSRIRNTGKCECWDNF